MAKLINEFMNVILGRDYRVDVLFMDASALGRSKGKVIYITKTHHDGEIGERSIGLPLADMRKLIMLIAPELNLSVKLILRSRVRS